MLLLFVVQVLDPQERVYPSEADPVHKMRLARLHAFNQVGER